MAAAAVHCTVYSLQDDIGLSGVVGSAVFNITLVVAVCALSAPQSLQLHWYPICRDCAAFLVSTVVLLFTVANRVVTW